MDFAESISEIRLAEVFAILQMLKKFNQKYLTMVLTNSQFSSFRHLTMFFFNVSKIIVGFVLINFQNKGQIIS